MSKSSLKRVLASVLLIAMCFSLTSIGGFANVDENNLGGAGGYTYIGGWSGVNNNEAWANNEDTMWKVTVYVAKSDKITNSSAYNLSDDYYKFGETFWLYANGRGVSNISNRSKLLIEINNKEDYVRGGKEFEEVLYESVKSRFFKYEDYFSDGTLPKVNNFGATSIAETKNFFEGNRAASNRFVELAAKAAGTNVNALLNNKIFTINGTTKSGWDLRMVDLRCSNDYLNDHSSCVSWVFLYEPVIIINNTLNSGYYHALTATGIAKSTLSGRYNFAYDNWSYRIVFKEAANIPPIQAQYWRWGTGFSFKSMPNSAYLSQNWLGYRSGDSFEKVTDSRYWYAEDQLAAAGFGLRYQRSMLPKVIIKKTVDGSIIGDLSGFSLKIKSNSTGSVWEGVTSTNGELAFYLPPGTYTITEEARNGYYDHEPQTFYVPPASDESSVITVIFDNKKSDKGGFAITKYADDEIYNDVNFKIYKEGSEISLQKTSSIKTDLEGKKYLEIKFEDVPVGAYVVKEIKQSRYAKVFSGSSKQTANESDETTVTVSANTISNVFFSNIIARNVTIQKTIDGSTSGNLEGFKFTVLNKDTLESFTSITNIAGIAEFKLVPGNYELTEDRKIGFEKPEVKLFTIPEDSLSDFSLQFNNKTVETAGTLTLSKICDIGGGFYEMEDVEFIITGNNGVNFTFTPYSSFLPRKIATVIVNNNTYEIQIKSFSASVELMQLAAKSAGPIITLADGSTTEPKAMEYRVAIGGLPPGEYQISEVNSGDWKKVGISVDFGEICERTSASFVMSAGKDTDVHFENYKNAYGSLIIKKTSSDNNVSGIKFKINAIDYVTDSDGFIKLYGINPGGYIITEQNPDPNKYINVPMLVENVPWYGEKVVSVHNVAKTGLTVNYIDVYTGEKIRDSFVKYYTSEEDYDVTDKILSPGEVSEGYTIFSKMEGDNVTGVMDCDKTINLYYGYTHKVTVNYYDMFNGNVISDSYQIKAEHGMLYDVKDKTGVLAEGYTFVDKITGDAPTGVLTRDMIVNVFEGYDDHSGEVTLTKYSYLSAPLAGAIFSLYKQDGSLVAGNLVSDANGKIHVSSLPFGTYYFKETSAPSGFKLSLEKVFFQINHHNRGTVQNVTLVNEPQDRSITLIKRIKISDIVFAHGNPTFIMNIEDESGHKKSGLISFDEATVAAYVAQNPEAEWIEGEITFGGLAAGRYAASEESVIRYELADNGIEIRSGNVTLAGSTAICDMSAPAATAKVAFSNEKTNQAGTSNTSVKINSFKTGRKPAFLTCEWKGGDTITVPKPSPKDLTVTVFYDDGTQKVLTGDEYVLDKSFLRPSDNGFKKITVSYTEKGIKCQDSFYVNVQIPDGYFTWSVSSDTPFYDDDGTYYDGKATIISYFGAANYDGIPKAVFGIRSDENTYDNNGKIYKVVAT